MINTIRIAVADDHDLMRKGLVNLLQDEPNFLVVSDVSNGALLLNEFRLQPIDVVLLDLEMPVLSGKEALKVISEKYPDTRVIIVSMHYTDEFILDCLGAGARAFLPKNSDIETVVDAINAVTMQGYYFDDRVSKAMLLQVTQGKSFEPTFTDEQLTTRELEVVQLICDGKTNKEIADQLFLSIRTVEVHRKNIARKTNATNIAGVVIYAIKNGIYSLG